MAAIALPPQPAMLAIMVWAGPDAQGLEGRQIQKARKEVLRHWTDRTGCLVEEEPEMEALSYQPIPPTRTFEVQVRYRFVGRPDPLPYPLADD